MQAGTLPVRGHGREAGHARAAREREQQGLDLIVGMLGQGNGARRGQPTPFGVSPGFRAGRDQGLVTALARRVLGALARRMARIDAADFQRDFQALA